METSNIHSACISIAICLVAVWHRLSALASLGWRSSWRSSCFESDLFSFLLVKICESRWWLDFFFNFSIHWELHKPNWGTYMFQRGRVQPPTRNILLVILEFSFCRQNLQVVVNVYRTDWKITMFNGKLTVLIAILTEPEGNLVHWQHEHMTHVTCLRFHL